MVVRVQGLEAVEDGENAEIVEMMKEAKRSSKSEQLGNSCLDVILLGVYTQF
jgi:hypothetical protein